MELVHSVRTSCTLLKIREKTLTLPSPTKTWARVSEAEDRFCATKGFRVEEHRSARLAGEMCDFTCDPEDAFPSAADSEP